MTLLEDLAFKKWLVIVCHNSLTFSNVAYSEEIEMKLEIRKEIGRLKHAVLSVYVGAGFLMAEIAHAQTTQVVGQAHTMLENIGTGLQGLGLGFATCVTAYKGFKVMSGHEEWHSIARPVGGAWIVGAAGTIAGWAMGGSLT